MRKGWRIALNAAGFQAVWLACIAGAGAGSGWLGPAVAAAFVAATLAWGGRPADDLRMLALALPFGLALDTAFAASGWLIYASAWPWPSAAPAWILALWAGFAVTLHHSMAVLRDRPGLAAASGAIGGPLAYWTAAGAFDAVSFGAPPAATLAALALAWGVVIPLLFVLDRRLAGGRVPAAGRRAPA